MPEASVTDPYVVTLLISYDEGDVSELFADIAFDVSVNGMEVIAKKQVDAWELFNEGDKIKFKMLIAKVLESVE